MDLSILTAATINGLLLGGIYTLVACGLTLIYGVLHIINFAHGSLLMVAMFGVYYLLTVFKIDPYVSLFIMVPAMFVLGYALYKGLIGRFSSGKDENILLITLGLSILLENIALMFFKGDSRTITVAYSDTMIAMGPTLVPLPKLISFAVAMLLCLALGWLIQRTDTGRAIRAVAKERMGARLVGLDVDKVYALFGLGLGAAFSTAPFANHGAADIFWFADSLHLLCAGIQNGLQRRLCGRPCHFVYAAGRFEFAFCIGRIGRLEVLIALGQ